MKLQIMTTTRYVLCEPDFYHYMQLKDITRALIYSVSVCYYARLTDREPFVQRIAKCFTDEYVIPGETDEEKVLFFVNEINR